MAAPHLPCHHWPMLHPYYGFYMHAGGRIRWDASASVPIYAVRWRPHRRPKVPADRRLVHFLDFFVVVDADAADFKFGHARIFQPPGRTPYAQHMAMFTVLRDDVIARYGMEVRDEYHRMFVRHQGEWYEVPSKIPEEQYYMCCGIAGEDGWLSY